MGFEVSSSRRPLAGKRGEIGMVSPFNVYAMACRSTPTLITLWKNSEAPSLARPMTGRRTDRCMA